MIVQDKSIVTCIINKRVNLCIKFTKQNLLFVTTQTMVKQFKCVKVKTNKKINEWHVVAPMMASKSLKFLFKVMLASAFWSVLMRTFAKWSTYLLNPTVIVVPRNIVYRHGQNKTIYETIGRRTLNNHSNNYEGKTLDGDIVSVRKKLYGDDCPFNPHKETLSYLFNHWMTLDNYYNISSFLCGGSLIGSLRNGDIIPYDRDIDVCVTYQNYQKLRVIRSGKPFDYRSSTIHLAVQEDFWNNDVSKRTLVDCWGRIVQRSKDPCSFETPGARLISRGVYVDIFVFREHGLYLRDHEYEKKHSRTDIFPLKDCMFMGVKAKCPHKEMPFLLKYYESDVLTKPHYVCRNGKWMATSQNAIKQFKIWFNKRLKRFYNRSVK